MAKSLSPIDIDSIHELLPWHRFKKMKLQTSLQKNVARYVITVDIDGNIQDVIRNQPCNTTALTVIGPHHIHSEEECVWLEIGMGNLYPYCRSHRGGREVAPREQFSSFQLKALQNFWPAVQEILIWDAQRVISSRKHIHWNANHKSKVDTKVEGVPVGEILVGVYYSISVRSAAFFDGDRHVLSAILRSELTCRQVPLKIDVENFVKFTSLNFGSYGDQLFSEDWIKKQLKKSKGKRKKLEVGLSQIESRYLSCSHLHWFYIKVGLKGMPGEELFYCALKYLDIPINWDKVSWFGEVSSSDSDGPLFDSSQVFLRTATPKYDPRIKSSSTNRDTALVFELAPKQQINDDSNWFRDGELLLPSVFFRYNKS